MKFVAVVTLAVLMSGCAQQQRARLAQQERIASDNVTAVCDQARSTPELHAIWQKVPKDPSQATIAQLSDPSFPSPAEQQAISHYDQVMEPCFVAQRTYLQTYFTPGSVGIYEALRADHKALRAQLWAGKITFGDYNTISARKALQAVNAARADVDRTSQIAAQQQLQRDQNMLLYLQQMQQNQPRPPVTTNCSSFGNSVSCTTR